MYRLVQSLRLAFISREKQEARSLVLDYDDRCANNALAAVDEGFAIEMGWEKPAPISPMQAAAFSALMQHIPGSLGDPRAHQLGLMQANAMRQLGGAATGGLGGVGRALGSLGGLGRLM